MYASNQDANWQMVFLNLIYYVDKAVFSFLICILIMYTIFLCYTKEDDCLTTQMHI